VAPHVFAPATMDANPWISAYDHHFWQTVLSLAVLSVFSRGRVATHGVSLVNWRTSLRLFAWFIPAFTAIVFAWNVLPFLISRVPPRFDYRLTPANITGWLTYMWLFAGISEELLFRGVIQTELAKTWTRVWIVRGVAVPSAGVVATVIFCLAHVSGWPVYWPQQLFAAGLGMYYSIVYHRTGSLLTPVLAHNYSNGIITAALYAVYWWLK
jgi:membrane protease YdiL (CAAX protease family)